MEFKEKKPYYKLPLRNMEVRCGDKVNVGLYDTVLRENDTGVARAGDLVNYHLAPIHEKDKPYLIPLYRYFNDEKEVIGSDIQKNKTGDFMNREELLKEYGGVLPIQRNKEPEPEPKRPGRPPKPSAPLEPESTP